MISEEEIICSQLNEIEDIREIPLSEGSSYIRSNRP